MRKAGEANFLDQLPDDGDSQFNRVYEHSPAFAPLKEVQDNKEGPYAQ
jgi:hypothetical protein